MVFPRVYSVLLMSVFERCSEEDPLLDHPTKLLSEVSFSFASQRLFGGAC